MASAIAKGIRMSSFTGIVMRAYDPVLTDSSPVDSVMICGDKYELARSSDVIFICVIIHRTR